MPSNALVTGVAGFIGSHLATRLLQEGYTVIGIDAFTDYYDPILKSANIASIRHNPAFSLCKDNLCTMDLSPVIQKVDYIFHEAAQAGVRGSWGEEFNIYVDHNILATQRLLEAARQADIKKFIFASSSSVYGNVDRLPMQEEMPLRPYSPYGVTKLAAENLCHLYHDNFGLPTVALRYFSVYGPRQRPDMAFNRFIRAILQDQELPLYGDGQQTRDFTYVQDIVEANLLAMQAPSTGQPFNIGGGSRVTVIETIEILEDLIGKKALLDRQGTQHGDTRHTWADTTAAQNALGFRPRVDLRQGLAAEIRWLRAQLEDS
jgi:UDP-glucose 4-epimerase